MNEAHDCQTVYELWFSPGLRVPTVKSIAKCFSVAQARGRLEVISRNPLLVLGEPSLWRKQHIWKRATSFIDEDS